MSSEAGSQQPKSASDRRAAAAANEAERQTKAKAEVKQAKTEADAEAKATAEAEAAAKKHADAKAKPPSSSWFSGFPLCARSKAPPPKAVGARREELLTQKLPPPPARTVDATTLAALSYEELRSAMEGAGLGGLVEPTWRSLSRLREGDLSPEAVGSVAPEALLACQVLERTPPAAATESAPAS